MQCPGCQTEVPDGLKQCPFCSAELTAAPMAAPAAPAKGRRRWREAVTAYLFLLPNIVGFLMFTLGPVFAAFALSFVRWDAVRPIEKAKFVGLDNYRQFLGWERDESTGDVRANDDRFWTYSYNTIYLMGGIPVGMALSLLLALLLNTKLRGVVVYRTIYFLPSICSMVAVALLWKWLYNTDFGLLNAGLRAIDDKVGVLSWTFENVLHKEFPPAWLNDPYWAKLALIIMGLWIGAGGYNCILYLAGLQGIPTELYEAADIDGAGFWHKLRHITWPMLSPTTFFIFVMAIIAGFQGGFTQINIMTDGGPAGSTTTILYYIYRHAFTWFKMGRACALAMILFVVIFAITLVNWRYGRRAVHYQ